MLMIYFVTSCIHVFVHFVAYITATLVSLAPAALPAFIQPRAELPLCEGDELAYILHSRLQVAAHKYLLARAHAEPLCHRLRLV